MRSLVTACCPILLLALVSNADARPANTRYIKGEDEASAAYGVGYVYVQDNLGSSVALRLAAIDQLGLRNRA